MARQPLIACALVLGSCLNVQPYVGAFEVPIAAAVLQPEVGGPFEEPVGLVANAHGGQIVPLALKQGRFLTDDPTAAFLRGHQLATGDARLLSSVAVRSVSTGEVTVWAGDKAFDRLLQVPWIVDCEQKPDDFDPCVDTLAGAPVEMRAYFEIEVEAPSASLSSIQVKSGWTTSETWVLEYDGRTWTLEGSRSGRQPEAVVPGEPYAALDRRLAFTLRDPGSEAGDRFEIRTKTGLTEHDVGGKPLALTLSPDQSVLALIVQDAALDRPFVRWFDPVAETLVGEVALPADAWPHRLSWSEAGRLLVSDRVRSAVYELGASEITATEIVLPWPTLDAAGLTTPDGERLYVVPLDGLSLWILDQATGSLVDVNPALPGVQGMTFTGNIRGIEAMPLPYLMPEYTDDQVRRTGRSVALSLASGTTVFAHEDTGCLVQDSLGPRTALDGAFAGATDFDANFESGVVGPPTLEGDGASSRSVVVNTCAGIAKEESWLLRYDQPLGGWRVEGSLSGEQSTPAIQDERYLSDDGAVSFTIRSGATPSRDGWTMSFAIDEGVAEADGDIDGDNTRDVGLPVSGDPVFFFYRVGLAGPVGAHDGEGWHVVDVRPFVLVPGASSDEVGRVDPQEALIEVGWE